MLAVMNAMKPAAPSVITYCIVCSAHSKGSAIIFSVSARSSHVSICIHKTLKSNMKYSGYLPYLKGFVHIHKSVGIPKERLQSAVSPRRTA